MRVVDGEEEHLSPKCASSQYTGCEPKKEKKKNQSRLCETQGDIDSTRSKGDVGFRPVC